LAKIVELRKMGNSIKGRSFVKNYLRHLFNDLFIFELYLVLGLSPVFGSCSFINLSEDDNQKAVFTPYTIEQVNL